MPRLIQSTDAFKYLASAELSPNLLPLVQSFNPDLLFGLSKGLEIIMQALEWLKVWLTAQVVATMLTLNQKFNPLPEALIYLWEDYKFMMLCDKAWSSPGQTFSNCQEILVQASPQLITILHACTVTPKACRDYMLFRIHFLLSLSWDDLRAAICSLRGVLGDNKAQLQELQTFSSTFLSLESTAILLSLANGGLHVITVMTTGEMDWSIRWVWSSPDHADSASHCDSSGVLRGWGFFLRTCPPSFDLLQKLSKLDWALNNSNLNLALHIEDLHNVVQWLKVTNSVSFKLLILGIQPLQTFSPPRNELVLILERRLVRWMGYDFASLEKQWTDWREHW